MFWGPSAWAGLRTGDAGNAEELGVQQNTSAVYTLWVGLPSLFELEDTQRSWTYWPSLLAKRFVCCELLRLGSDGWLIRA